MKNIYDVLRQKENEIQQLQRDIEALRVAARILADENDGTGEAFNRSANSASNGAVTGAPALRPPTPAASVGKPAEVTYSAARENSLRQFP